MSARDFVPPAYSLRATRCRSVGCQGDGTDHQCLYASRLENAGHLLGSPNHLIGI